MNAIQSLLENASDIENRIGYNFKNRENLILAFVHRSFVNENRTIGKHNERLEFLGDSVLGLIVAEFLYLNFPEIPEGDLSYLRSRLVEAGSCRVYVQKLGIDHFLLLGKGERMSGARGKESILADFFEALFGAIFLDGGLEAAKKFLFSNFLPEIQEILKGPVSNWKAMLQDFCQKTYKTTPIYKVMEEIGPDHSKQFRISVHVQGEQVGEGMGSSKKEAQQAAASNALTHLKLK